MKKKFLSLAVALLSLVSASAYETTIWSYRAWQAETNPPVSGPIKYKAVYNGADKGNLVLIADQSKLGKAMSGGYYNYEWYVQVIKPGTESSVEGLYTMNMETGERTLIAAGGTKVNDMTYDYEDNVMYGLKSSTSLVKINLETGATTAVADFKTAGGAAAEMLAIACDVNNQMYGVSPDGYFYKINKKTGQVVAVGALGIEAAYTQSMSFDRYTNKLYWANNAYYALFEINLTTGEASPLSMIDGGEGSTNAMAIPYIDAPLGSPDRVTGRKAVASGSDVIVSWVNPAVDIQGEAMADFTGVKIYRDGTLVATVDGKAGEAASYVDKGLAKGQYEYKIVPFNSKGEGGVDTKGVKSIVGGDAPGAVENLKVVSGNSEVNLSWDAPTKGLTGGDYDPTSVIEYVVTRTKGTSSTTFKTATTSYTDAPAFGTYTYSVYAVNAAGNGAVATAAPVMVKPNDWIVMMSGEAVVETGKTYTFYDAGGPDANYPNSEIDTLVIRPSLANGAVKVEFVKFDVEAGYDELTVFNGSSVDAPKIGTFSAEDAVPADLILLESTSEDGALTFVFQSDVMSNCKGWEAKVYASEKVDCDLAIESFGGNLYVEEGDAGKYVVKLQNKGASAVAGADYKVVLKDASGAVLAEANGVDVATTANVEIEIEATFAKVGEVAVTATIECAKDGDGTNNTSSIIVNVIAKGSKFVEVGDGAEKLSVCPIDFDSFQSISQTLYFADEIGVEDGLLKMISYPYHTVKNNYLEVPIKVWVVETDRVDLNGSNFVANDMTLVFEGNVPVRTTDAEFTIQLDKGYEYKGGNLAVMVFKETCDAKFGGVSFKGSYGSSGDPQRTRFDSPWYEDESVSPDAKFGWDADTHLPMTKFLFLPGAGVGSVVVDDANAPVEYYNLQGVKVVNPSNGIFIKVQGSKATKEYVK